MCRKRPSSAKDPKPARAFKKLREEGSSSLTLLATVASMTMAGLYVNSLNSRTQSAIDGARKEASKEMAVVANTSSFSVMRSLLSERRLSATLYQPAIYPDNYFASTWNLVKNSDIAQPSVEAKGQIASVLTYSATDWFPGNSGKIFLGQERPKSEMQPVELVALHRDPAFPYYVNAVDVVVKSSGATPIANRARISLPAPSPGGIEVWIREENEAAFTQNFGSEASPRNPGKYFVQVKGSGVVYFAEVNLGTEKQVVGLNDSKKVTHAANNVKSPMQIIGATKNPFTVEGSSGSGGGPCAGGTTTTNAKLALSAKLIGVDGRTESPSGTASKDLFIVQSASGSPAFTPANFVPELASASEKAKTECIMKTKKIWDPVNRVCTSITPMASCNNLASLVTSGGARSLVNDGLNNPNKRILNCANNGPVTLFTVLEIIGQCQAQIVNHCEFVGLPASTPAVDLFNQCLANL